MYPYDETFFDYINDGSLTAARIIVPLLRGWLPINSVLDVGCGQGAWLRVWREQGVQEIFGLDGGYIERRSLLIPADCFRAVNLGEIFSLGRRFDLVSCLEVVEHMPESTADGLVESLCAHGGFVLFSAACPGQGGENHVNEQDYGYWQARFERFGFTLFDCVRPAIGGDRRIKRWYRYNTFLYVPESLHAALLPAIRSTAVPAGSHPADVSPLWYRLRKRFVRQLPASVVAWIAVMNKRWIRL